MAVIGYHASHEQFTPSALLEYVQLAEKSGFQAVNSSDHFFPWSEKQGESGFAWSWLGAALQCTKLPFSIVNAPGQRYHPAIIAQAVATLDDLFPGRFIICVGSGQAMNEHITGEKWPEKQDRNTRLHESFDIIQKLLQGQIVSHKGFVKVEGAKLYTRPKTKPLIFGAALTPETASWMGKWVDGLITVSQPLPDLKKVVDAFRKSGGKKKPFWLKVQLSYAGSDEKARKGAWEQWRNNIFESRVLSDLSHPSQFDAMGKFVKPDEIDPYVHISSDLKQHKKWILAYIKLGFERIILHNVNLDQETFIKDFGRAILSEIL